MMKTHRKDISIIIYHYQKDFDKINKYQEKSYLKLLMNHTCQTLKKKLNMF